MVYNVAKGFYRCFPSMSFGYWFVEVTIYNVIFSGHNQVLGLWGCIGIYSDDFGFKNIWEIC